MIDQLGAILYHPGDLGDGWEAGPAEEPQGMKGIKNVVAKADRRLFRSGNSAGGSTLLMFSVREHCENAMAKMEPDVTSIVAGRVDYMARTRRVALLGERAVIGTARFHVQGMEALGMAPKLYPTVLFMRGFVVVHIRSSGLTEDETYAYARKIDARLQVAFPS
jgi:hypothetical protein